jgi:hypothetical protein
MKEKEAITIGSDERFKVRFELMRDSVRDLATELLMIEAEGDYVKAREFLNEYGRVPEELSRAMAKVEDLPIDIEPDYDVLKLIGSFPCDPALES